MKVRGLLLGSGAGMAEPGMAERVIELAGAPAAGTEVLYLGTASYDREEARERQSRRLTELGCRVSALEVAMRPPAAGEMEELVTRASVILVSGGNTLYAVDRWAQLGLDRILRTAVERGAVVCGGSAGAICWFDGGHSDSMDPTTYRQPLPSDHPDACRWRYVRVDGLGLVPGLLCPHYDATQSNGVPRAADFAAMLARHPGETGLGLDDWAGLLLDGARFELVAAEGRPGSMRGSAFVDDGSGRPGAWVLELRGGRALAVAVPSSGATAELLPPARAITPDPLLALARVENPLPAS